MNADSYKELERPTVETGTPAYRLDDPRLFEKIITQEIPPGPGPHITSEAAQSYILGAPNAR
jgi:cytochrome o ubiquinol oxidase subunit 2